MNKHILNKTENYLISCYSFVVLERLLEFVSDVIKEETEELIYFGKMESVPASIVKNWVIDTKSTTLYYNYSNNAQQTIFPHMTDPPCILSLKSAVYNNKYIVITKNTKI